MALVNGRSAIKGILAGTWPQLWGPSGFSVEKHTNMNNKEAQLGTLKGNINPLRFSLVF
jgi:hypothetical protein